MGVTILNSGRPVGLNIHRREVHLTGNGHDIARVQEACAKKLKHMEENRIDPDKMQTVVVQAPHEDEP